MSVFAGVYARLDDTSVLQSASRDIRSILGSGAGGQLHEYRDASFYLAKLDLGAFPDSGWYAGSGEVIAAAGNPFFAGHARSLPRADALRGFAHEEGGKGEALLRGSRGSFSFCRYEPGPKQLTLGTDRLGVRPIYVYASPGIVVFATALHILESIAAVPRQLSVRGVIELAVFECTLSTRTAFAGIERLHAAELLHFDQTLASRTRYWRWDMVPTAQQDTTDIAKQAHEQFMEAVAMRLGASQEARSFLSGGLDARCVIAALRSMGVNVDSYTFADPGTQDRVFAAEFAAAAGLRHHQHAMPEGKPDWSGMISAATALAVPGRAANAARRVWSGDGGSVGIGHVQVTPGIIAHMRRGNTDAACRLFLRQEQKRIPQRLFVSSMIGKGEDLLVEGMEQELERVPQAEPGRRFHLFLLLNDQRNHLWRHFEGLLQHRIELVTPFFDSDFLATVITANIDDCLGHNFYYSWMGFFDAVVRTVPWQAYPGHLPCPISVESRLRHQWDASHARARNRNARWKILRRGAGVVLGRRFPNDILRRSAMAGAVLATGLGIRDYEYALHTGILVKDYWQRSGGSVATE